MLKKRDDFEDILEERRHSSDLRYALRCYTPVLYKGVEPCKASTLKSIVLQSDQVHHVVGQVSWRRPGPLLDTPEGCGWTLWPQGTLLFVLILQVSKETGRAPEEVQEEAAAILEEMAQCLQLSTVRFFAFTLSKIFKTLFRSICVNEDGIQRVSTQICCSL